MADTPSTQGVIAQARAAAPSDIPGQSTQATPQGFGAPAAPSGFTTPPAPVAPVADIAPAAPEIQTSNDRTKEQFEKLVESNQRIVQQNEQLRQDLQRLTQTRQQTNQQFEPVSQVPPAQPNTQSVLPKLSDYVEVDPATGERFVNEARFNSAMSQMTEAYQKASRAEQVVQNYVQTAEQREIARQESEAFSSYPQLNPKGEGFDGRLSKQTRAVIYDSMMNPQDYPTGRPLTFREAADYVAKGVIGGPVTSSNVITPTVNEANQAQKEQAAASVPSVPQAVSLNADTEREYQRLVMGTRTGSDEAIAVRLLNATHKMEDVEQEIRR